MFSGLSRQALSSPSAPSSTSSCTATAADELRQLSTIVDDLFDAIDSAMRVAKQRVPYGGPTT